VGHATRVQSEFVNKLQSDLWKMRSREAQSPSFGLTARTVKLLAAAVWFPGGFVNVARPLKTPTWYPRF